MGRLYRYSMDTVGHARAHRACDPVWMRDFGRVYWVVRSRLVVWSPSRPEAERWPIARGRPDARDTSVHPEFTTRTMSAQFATQSIVRYVFVSTPVVRVRASGAGAMGAIGAGVRSRYRAVDREDTAASGRAFARGACVARASRGARGARDGWGKYVCIYCGASRRGGAVAGARAEADGRVGDVVARDISRADARRARVERRRVRAVGAAMAMVVWRG